MWGFLAFAPEMSQLCTADELGNWTEELGVFFYPKTYAIWKVSCWETCLHIFWYSKEPSWEVNINPLQGIFASMWIFLFPYVTSLEGTPFPFGRLSILRFPLVASLCGATNWSNLRSSQVWNESMKGETQNHVEKSHFNLGSCHGVDWFYIFSKGRLGDFCLRFFLGIRVDFCPRSVARFDQIQSRQNKEAIIPIQRVQLNHIEPYPLIWKTHNSTIIPRVWWKNPWMNDSFTTSRVIGNTKKAPLQVGDFFLKNS